MDCAMCDKSYAGTVRRASAIAPPAVDRARAPACCRRVHCGITRSTGRARELTLQLLDTLRALVRTSGWATAGERMTNRGPRAAVLVTYTAARSRRIAPVMGIVR